MSQFRTIEVSNPRFEREGLREVTFKSPSLRGRADMTLFVPPGIDGGKNVPLVILLHGVYGSHWAWTGQAGAHHTARSLIEQGQIPPMALAMPSDGLWGDGSGYIPHASTTSDVGRNFERFIVDEVPACAREVLPAVSPSSPLFIGGLSMGGFGALRLGAKYASRFRAISAHSAITDFSQMKLFVEEPLDRYGPLTPAEQSALACILSNRAHLPPLRFDCGTQDPLLDSNRRLHADLEEHRIPHTYEEFPGGHEWIYWERHLEKTLRFFAQCLAGK